MKIPIIVLQYGRFELTKQCIESLRNQTAPIEVVLVDGNSPGKTKEILNSLGEKSDRKVFLEKNLGYAGANNVAIKQIVEEGYEFIMILNNDTILEPDCVEKLYNVMKGNPRVAQVCPKVMYPDGRLQSAGARIYKPLFEPQLIGHLEDGDKYTHEVEVEYAPGVAVLVRTEAIREVGTIPEEYFMYAEDVDWSLSFKKKGWKIIMAPNARITHYDSASLGTYNRKKGYYMVRANVMLAHKWLSIPEWSQYKKAMFIKIIRQSIKYISHPSYVKGMWQGYLEGVKGK